MRSNHFSAETGQGEAAAKADESALEAAAIAREELDSQPLKRLRRTPEDSLQTLDSQATLILGEEEQDMTPRYENAGSQPVVAKAPKREAEGDKAQEKSKKSKKEPKEKAEEPGKEEVKEGKPKRSQKEPKEKAEEPGKEEVKEGKPKRSKKEPKEKAEEPGKEEVKEGKPKRSKKEPKEKADEPGRKEGKDEKLEESKEEEKEKPEESRKEEGKDEKLEESKEEEKEKPEESRKEEAKEKPEESKEEEKEKPEESRKEEAKEKPEESKEEEEQKAEDPGRKEGKEEGTMVQEKPAKTGQDETRKDGVAQSDDDDSSEGMSPRKINFDEFASQDEIEDDDPEDLKLIAEDMEKEFAKLEIEKKNETRLVATPQAAVPKTQMAVLPEGQESKKPEKANVQLEQATEKKEKENPDVQRSASMFQAVSDVLNRGNTTELSSACPTPLPSQTPQSVKTIPRTATPEKKQPEIEEVNLHSDLGNVPEELHLAMVPVKQSRKRTEAQKALHAQKQKYYRSLTSFLAYGKNMW